MKYTVSSKHNDHAMHAKEIKLFGYPFIDVGNVNHAKAIRSSCTQNLGELGRIIISDINIVFFVINNIGWMHDNFDWFRPR